MYVGQIVFPLLSSDLDDVSHIIDLLLSALRMNGQICGREFPVAVTETGYVATVLLPDQDALDPVYFNRYIRNDLEKANEIGLDMPEFRILGQDVDGDEPCKCVSPSTLILYTNYVSLESPLRCGDCFRPRPLYRIPATYQDEYYNIICWQSDYQACDTLQMNCRTLERAATQQLSRADSSLSQQGIGLCKQIAELTRTPTYYRLYRYGGRSLKKEQERRCPVCGGAWLLQKPWHLFDFRCDTCHLVSNIAWNVQKRGEEPQGQQKD